SSLLGMRSGSHFQVDIWLRHPELLEEYVRHIEIVVLASMYKYLIDPSATCKSLQHRSGLHEIWTCTHDMKNFHNVINTEKSERQSLAAFEHSQMHCCHKHKRNDRKRFSRWLVLGIVNFNQGPAEQWFLGEIPDAVSSGGQ